MGGLQAVHATRSHRLSWYAFNILPRSTELRILLNIAESLPDSAAIRVNPIFPGWADSRFKEYIQSTIMK